jgi:hypothetical protein
MRITAVNPIALGLKSICGLSAEEEPVTSIR